MTGSFFTSGGVALPALDEDHTTATYADGRRVAYPAAATDEQKRQAEAEALRRELEGVEYRLQHLDDAVLPHQEPPSRESVERTRTGLENTRAVIVARLAELEPAPTKGKRK